MLKSLQARLIAAAFVVLLTCGGLAALGSYRAALIEADEILDAHLAQLVQTLLFLSQVNDSRSMGDIGVAVQSDHSYTTFQIWQLKQSVPEAAGLSALALMDTRPFPRLILRSGDMGNPAEGRRAFDRQDGYSNDEFATRALRILARTSADGVYRVIAGQDLLDRQEMVQGIARSNIQPYLLILPLGILALIGLIYYSLGSIRRLTAEVALCKPGREPGQLTLLSIHDVPQELKPLITALNALLQRQHHAMESERRFTGDAARMNCARRLQHCAPSLMRCGWRPTKHTHAGATTGFRHGKPVGASGQSIVDVEPAGCGSQPRWADCRSGRVWRVSYVRTWGRWQFSAVWNCPCMRCMLRLRATRMRCGC